MENALDLMKSEREFGKSRYDTVAEKQTGIGNCNSIILTAKGKLSGQLKSCWSGRRDLQ